MKAKIIIPTTLSEIRLGQYQELMRLQNEADSNDIAAKKMISMLCKIKMSEVHLFPAGDVFTIMAKLNDIWKQQPDFEPTFKIGDYEFGFVPDLENITFGEYVDAEKYLQQWETMNNAMAVLYRPIKKRKGEQYEIEPYYTSTNYAEIMKLAPLNVVLGCCFFLTNLKRELLNVTMNYLPQQTETKEIIPQKEISPIDGDGIKAFILSAEETLDKWTQLPHYRCINASLT